MPILPHRYARAKAELRPGPSAAVAVHGRIQHRAATRFPLPLLLQPAGGHHRPPSGQDAAPPAGQHHHNPTDGSQRPAAGPKTREILKPDPHPVHAYAAAGDRAPAIVRDENGDSIFAAPDAARRTPWPPTPAAPAACGLPSKAPGAATASGTNRSNMAVASLVLGIISIPAFFFIVPAALAIVFGVIALLQSRRGEATGGDGPGDLRNCLRVGWPAVRRLDVPVVRLAATERRRCIESALPYNRPFADNRSWHVSHLGILRHTFLDTVVQPIYTLLLGLGAAIIIIFAVLPFFTLGEDTVMFKSVCLDVVLVITLVATLFMTSKAIYEEVEDRTMLNLMSKPVKRREVAHRQVSRHHPLRPGRSGGHRRDPHALHLLANSRRLPVSRRYPGR